MLKVEVVRYDDLTDKEKDSSLSNNGSGKEFASYLRVSHPDRDAFLESDAMEPEDATFGRDLSWIANIIMKCYEQGKLDGMKKEEINE